MSSTSNNVRPQNKTRFHTGATPPSSALDPVAALRGIVAAAISRDELHRRLLDWLTSRPGCLAVCFHSNASDSASSQGPSNFAAAPFASESLDESVQHSAMIALSGKVTSAAVDNIRNMRLVSVPIDTRDGSFDALTAAMIVDPNRNLSDFPDLAIAATHASLWHERSRQANLEEQLALTAATIDLLAIVDQADNFRAATVGVANSLREHFDCRAVALAMRKQSSSRLQIAAISGLPEFDSSAQFTETLKEALDETIVRDRLTVFPSSDTENRDTLLSHQRLASTLQAARLVSFPLKDVGHQVVGAWIAVLDSAVLDSAVQDNAVGNEKLETLMRAAAPRVADALLLARRADSSLFNRPRNTRNRARRLMQFGIAGIVTAGIMAIPVPYQVHCQCSAEPEIRRFIVAPHEGLLEKTFVQPGDLVTAGDRLAQMDGRDVRWELAGLVAEREKVAKQRDSYFIEGDVAAAQRASLELKRIESREQLLRQRQSKLQLTSPIDGIVLDGHLDRVENAPVTIGQALYEVAPLSPVAVEIAIPDDEHSHVEIGDEVHVRFDGVDKVFDGQIQRIHPKSEVRDGENVFVAEVVLSNADEGMRPGMNGYARVKSATHSLAWNLLHKPWEHFRQSLPF